MNEIYMAQRDQNGPFKLVKLTPVPDRVIGFDADGTVTVVEVMASGGGDAHTNQSLAQFAPTTSAELAGVITNETGTNKLVFSDGPTLNNPVLVAPNIGTATATTVNKVAITQPATSAAITILNGKTLTVDNTLELAGTDGTKMTFPSTSGSVVTSTSTDTLTNKTINASNNTVTNIGTSALANNAVTYAKMQAVVGADKLLGSGNSGAGSAPVEITLGPGLSMTGTTLSGTSAATSDPIWDAKGDLLVATGNNAATRVGVGTDGQFLTADSGQSTGVAWTTPTIGSLIDPVDGTKQLDFDISAFPTATTYTLTPASGDSVTVIPSTGTTLQAMTGIGGDGIETFNSFSRIVSSVALTGQTGSIAAASFQFEGGIAPAGMYRVVYYIVATTAGTSGTLDVAITWNDGASTRSDSIAGVITFGSTDYFTNSVIIRANGATNVQYSTTINTPVGSPAYSFYATMERLI